MTNLNIGEVAKGSGVPSKTIRYYEEISLIPVARRASNGYRVYTSETIQILRFIKRARELGFQIADVFELLSLWRDKSRSSAEVKKIATQHIAHIEQKIFELTSLKRTLDHLVKSCRGDGRPSCPILDDLADGHQMENSA